ncbi:MAG: carboxypeptidase-like regulatory domain-containing protein [Planctomycetota bacterium]
MQKLALPVVGLVVILLVLLLARAPSTGVPDRVSRDATTGSDASHELAQDTELAAPDRASDDPNASTRSTLENALAGASEEVSRSRGAVSGLIVDENERPLPDVLVQLSTLYDAWSPAGEATPVVPIGDFRRSQAIGFETRTDEAGTFRLEFPPPSAERVSLTIVPDRYHVLHRLWFWSDESGDRRRLGAGQRDLGTIRLERAGVVFGRITDEDGAPLADVEVDAGTESGRHLRVRTRTGPDGRYVVAHAPAATHGILAERDGFLSAFHEPVELVPGQDTGPVDVALGRAQSIRGIVVDAEGAPIEGVRISGRTPPKNGVPALVTSASDGAFTFHLPTNEPATLQARHRDFVRWGDDQDGTTTFEPGLSELRIVMERAEKTRFVVVDRETGDPVERFGFLVLPRREVDFLRPAPTSQPRPAIRDRPGGVVEAAAKPREDRYLVRAEGYPTVTGTVRHARKSTPVQKIRLRRGSTVVGRAVRNGEPIGGVDVRIEQGQLMDVGRPQPLFVPMHGTHLNGATDAAGQFEFAGLRRSRYRLTLSPGGGPAVFVDIERTPKRGEMLDLGDVELVRGGTIDGVVMLPSGSDLEGISIRLDEWGDGPTAITDGDGRFAFDGVLAGEHRLLVLGEREGIGRGAAGTAIVVDGETTSVELDLTSHLTLDVELSIELNGSPAEGLRVKLVAIDGGSEAVPGHVVFPKADLGRTDESGTVRGEARPLGRCRVEIYSSDLGTLEHPAARIDLVPGRPVKETVHFEAGALALDLSDTLPLPENGSLSVRLMDPGPPKRGVYRKIPIVDGAIDPTAHAFAAFEDGLLVLTCLPAGPFEWSVSAFAADAKFVWTEQPDGSRKGGTERAFEHTGTTTVEIDWRATVTVP